VPGTPDNWQDFYPTEGHGRGDSWIGPKQQIQRDKELQSPGQPNVFLSANDRRFAQQNPEFARLHPEALSGNVRDRTTQPQFAPNTPHNSIWGSGGGPEAEAARAAMHDPSHDAPVAQGKPGVYDWERGGWPVGTDQTALILQKRGIKPGPLTKIGGAPGSGGYYQGGNTIIPPGQQAPGAPAGKTAAAKAPATNDQLGKWFATMKPGATMDIQGKKYFKNQNGAAVDVTNPAARKRVTDRSGAFIGQAGAPPPPGTTPPGTPAATTPPGRVPIGNQPPPTTPGGDVPRGVPPAPIIPPEMQQQYPPVTQQPQQQYDPYSMNQFAYPQGQGPGPYGWNPGYGGSPFDYSNMAQQLAYGMGGYGGGMINPGYGSISAYDGGNYAGRYGWPEQQMYQGVSDMGGGMGGYGNEMAAVMPGGMSFGGDMMQGMGGYGGGYGDPYGGMGGFPADFGYGMGLGTQFGNGGIAY
jgi:hypothetical protein